MPQVEGDEDRHDKLRKDFEFAQELMRSENRKRAMREFVNTLIALSALMASFYSVFVAHHDAGENLQLTQRAYVAVESDNASPPHLSMRATAGSPATAISASAFDREFPDDVSDVPTQEQWAAAGEETHWVQNALLLPGGKFPIPPAVKGYTLGKDKTIHIAYGVIHYKDIFGHAHTTRYCYRAGESPCEKGNDAD